MIPPRSPLPLLALSVALIAPSLAQAASHDRDVFIREQDRNGDGKVTKDEFAAGRAEEFARQDTNHDGKLSEEEYVADFKARLERDILPKIPADKREEERQREMRQVVIRFGVLDSDHNGVITIPEWDYSGWRMFMHHDTNKDGVVSKDDPIAKDDA